MGNGDFCFSGVIASLLPWVQGGIQNSTETMFAEEQPAARGRPGVSGLSAMAAVYSPEKGDLH